MTSGVGSHLYNSLFTYEEAEKRLVEAMELWRRAPDRERGWHHVKAMWPEIQRHAWRVDVDGEFDEREAVEEPRRPRLTRDQIASMIEASEWLAFVPERDRRLVVMVLALKARGIERIRWVRLWDRLGRGRPGPDGLRSRYSRSITAIAQALSD